jgi:hypothetical protein
MPIEYLTEPMVEAPVDAIGVALAGPGTAWLSTAYSTLIASTATAITLAGINLRFGTTVVEVEIDIAVGGAGSEVVVGTLRAANRIGSTIWPPLIPFPFPITGIGAGQRVSCRLRVSTTTTTTFRVTLQYYASANLAAVTTTGQPSKVYPPAAAGISLTTSADWVYSAWSTLVTTTSTAIVVPTLIISPSLSAFDWEVELGMGLAGSETVLTTARGHSKASSNVVGPANHLLIPAFDAIPAGSRLAVRMRKSGSFGGAFSVAALYYEKPL